MCVLLCRVVLSLPLYLGYNLRHKFGTSVCSDTRSETEILVFTCVQCAVQFVLPLFAVSGYYVKIYVRLRGRPASQHSEEASRRRHTNKLLLSIVVGFFVS